MKAVLLRTASGPIQASSSLGSPRLAFSDQGPAAVLSFPGRNSSPAASERGLHVHYNASPRRSFRRTLSEANWDPAEGGTTLGRSLSRRFSRLYPDMIAELTNDSDAEEDAVAETEGKEEGVGVGTVVLKRGDFGLGISGCDVTGIWSVNEVLQEEFGLTGEGTRQGSRDGGGRVGGRGGGDGIGDLAAGGSADQNRMGAYYREMLKANPRNPLLLRNYGKYLHEVEKDVLKAEEYYGRAILASPEDGEVLSMYGKLIWETQRDQGRAQSYFDQAIKASPDNW